MECTVGTVNADEAIKIIFSNFYLNILVIIQKKKIELKTKSTLIHIWVPLYQANTRTHKNTNPKNLLIPIFMTHFYKLNSIELDLIMGSIHVSYHIILTQAHGGNWGSVVWRVWISFFRTFYMSMPMRATKWARDIGSTSSSWRKSCIQNFHLKRVFMLWLTSAQNFCSSPFLPLNIVGSH